MPNMTSFDFGDILLVPFLFTNQIGRKQRPAVVISNKTYNQARPDIILIAITSQVKTIPGFGETLINDWQNAGLLKPSVIKPVIFTIEQMLVKRTLGQITEKDQESLKKSINGIIG